MRQRYEIDLRPGQVAVGRDERESGDGRRQQKR